LNYKAGDGYLASAPGRSNQLALFIDSTGRVYSVLAQSLSFLFFLLSAFQFPYLKKIRDNNISCYPLYIFWFSRLPVNLWVDKFKFLDLEFQ
jgi:hypothetical protein